LYWDAPGPVAGVVEVAGSVSSNTVDTPDGFPMARGVARRVRMEWREFVHDGQRRWSYADGEARYEQVEASYFPIQEAETGDPTFRQAPGRLNGRAYSLTWRSPSSRRREDRTAQVEVERTPAEPRAIRQHRTISGM
jgi:hypothetical protein